MKKKGFNLVELMIAVSIFTIFTLFMYRFFFDEQKFFMTLHRQIDLQYNANTALEYLGGAVRNNVKLAFREDTVYEGSKYRIWYTDNTRSTVLFDMTGSGSSGEMKLNSGDKTLKDSQDNTLCRNIDTVEIGFDTASNDIINITVKLSSGSGSRKVDYTAKTSINIKK